MHPAHGPLLRELLDARSVLVPGAGTLLPLDAPAELADAVRYFLARAGPSLARDRRPATDPTGRGTGGAAMTAPSEQAGLRKGERTRRAILQAAREQFQHLGYDAASIRSIAAAATIDPSMVMRYFGSKEGLFAAAVDVDLRLPDLAGGPVEERGLRLVEHFLARWEGNPADDVLVLLLRSAVTHDAARQRMHAVFAQQLGVAVAAVTEPGTAERRAALIATQMLGLALCRYVLQLPGVATATASQLVADLAPTVQRYLAGPLPDPTE
jgi:AcrR family transcriptional regulator